MDRLAARIAARQDGVIARTQASAAGVSPDAVRHRLATGRWVRAGRHAFVIAGAPASWRCALTAAVLGWGEAATVSHRSAAALWGLAGFEPGPVELIVPRSRRRDAPGRVRRLALEPADRTRRHGLPVTTVARTLLDLAATCGRERVEAALDDAVRRRLVTPRALRARLDALAQRGRAGVAPLRRLLDLRDPLGAGPQSVLETRLLRAFASAGLPPPVAQHRVRASGRLVAVVDFAYPGRKVAIEADGYRWHSSRRDWERDRRRRNELTLLGWRVVHVTATDLAGSRARLARTLRAAVLER